MSEMIQLDNLSLDTLTELAKKSFADCQDALQVYLNNEKKLQRFGHILKACREKVPHGKWQQWVLETFAGHLSIRAVQLWISDAEDPEKREKRLEQKAARRQEEKKAKAQPVALLAEQSPAPPVSSGVIRHENPPSQPQRPAWLADPDELDRPEEDELQPLPRTNTHHTAENRRTPDARETDRAGLVSPDDPRELQDGAWYVWSEDRNRLLPVTDEDVMRRFDQIRRERAPRAGQVMPVIPWPPKTTSVVEPAKDTTPVVEHKQDSVSNKPGKLPTLGQLRAAVDAKAEWGDLLRESAKDWAAYKMTLAGKDKIRSMESWQKALTRMGNVARDRSVGDVCEAIEKAIANGWTGWEHLGTGNDRKLRGAVGGRVYQQLQKAEVKYDPLPE